MMNSLYMLNHLLISKEEYKPLPRKPQQGIKSLSIAETEPDAKTVRYWVEQVGAPYGWPDREQYTLEAIEEILTKPGIRLFILQRNVCPIGYCLVHNETEHNLRAHLKKAEHNIAADANITRIEGFGLADKYTKKDFGDFYLQSIFQILFDHGENDYVYLTSRSTNHPRVIPFYLENGMHVIDTEQKPEDRRPSNSITTPVLQTIYA